MELGTSKDCICRIMVEHLGYWKVFAHFELHIPLTTKKCSESKIVMASWKSQKGKNYLYKTFTGNEKWGFQYDPESKRPNSKWRPQ